MADKEDVPGVAAVDLGDPAAFAGMVEAADEIGDDARKEGLEGRVQAELFGVTGYPGNLRGGPRVQIARPCTAK